MEHLFGSYTGPFSLTSVGLNASWANLYRETLQDIKTLIPIAENREIFGLVGMAKIIKAYSFITLVDVYGDVPYTEALQGDLFPNPKADSGQMIYSDMLTVLDEAINDLSTPNALMPENDLFYEGDKEKWIKIAHTLKLKMYVQMRLVENYTAEINNLIASGNLIMNSNDDFEFQYTTDDSSTGDSRAPNYAVNYNNDGANDYMNSYFVNLLKSDKGFADPRLRYYFYRQINEEPTGDDLSCDGNPAYNFCYLGDFYWTRDHGDESGVPQDGLKRTTYGLYPFGGAFDGDNFLPVTENSGAGGAGIQPFMLSSYVKFLLAESALMSGTSGDPRALLENAIRDSMDKVLNFIPSQVDNAFAPTPTEVNNYVSFVLNEYDNATNNTEKLDIIMKEYYIALWGNGIEAWNNYRRTSMPSDLSDHVATPGIFPRTFMYPANVVNTNSSIDQKSVNVKTFWDTNPDNLD